MKENGKLPPTAQEIREDLIRRRLVTPTNAIVLTDACIKCSASFERLAKDTCKHCGNCWLNIRNSGYH